MESLFAGGGEMGARMRSMDWSRTPLGPVDGWPAGLRTCLRIILTSRQPMFVWWGDALINLYNDAYKAIVGGKHPEALGQPASVVWREIWDQVGPRAGAAMQGNEGTYDEALLLIMERHGYQEETYYTFSYSPVPNDQGGTGGILCANTDDTQRIIGARRMALLRDLASRMSRARTWEEACSLGAESLGTERRDLPFALVYILDPDRNAFLLAGLAGIARGHAAVPERIDAGDGSAWPVWDVLKTQGLARIPGLPERFGPLPGGAWDRGPGEAVAVPIAPAGQTGRAGVLVVGLNPFRPWDEDYRSFLALAAGQIASAIAAAQAYEEERRRSEALAELDRAKTVFFSNVSHEFRTPLTLMLGPIEDSLGDAVHPLDEVQRGRQELVHRNGLRLLKLVNTLLDFSRIEAGRAQASYVPTDLPAYTAELASGFRSAMEKAGLDFSVACPPLPEPVFVDRDMWEKIVLNLLSNALKFTLRGGVSVSLRPAGNRVELKVRDTGAGIPPEELPRVFTRFHRILGVQARTQEGSGIGLALVQELAKLHGGSAEVESAPGAGTTFTVSIPMGMEHLDAGRIAAPRRLVSTGLGALPFVEEALRWLPAGEEDGAPAGGAHPDPVPAGKTPRPAGEARGTAGGTPGPSAGRARILLADDNRDMRDYVKRILEDRWQVDAVGNGAAALASAIRNPPDLILSDVMMPELDGFQLLKALRSDPATASVPVILLSARAGEEARMEGLEGGADDYLVKPFTARELLARVAVRIEIDRLRSREREQADRLRASESFNRQLVENSPDCIKVLDREARLQSMNQRGLEILGIRDLAPYLDRKYADMWPEPYRPVAEAALEAARSGRLGRFQGEFPAAGNGESKWWDVIIVPLPDADGRPDRFLAVSRDITPLQEAERDVHKFLSLIEESSDFIGIGNLESVPIYINAAGRRMVGLGEDADLGALKGGDFYFPDDGAFRARVNEGFAQSGRWEGEMRLRHFKTGRPIPVWINVFQLKDRNTGRPFAIATVTRDLTRQKETEDHLRQSQKIEAIGKLAGGIAHDFNNLLTAINGYAELSLGLPGASGALLENLLEIRKSGERAALLTNQLLAFSRKQMLAPKPINLNAILSDMENLLRRLIGEDIDLVSRLDPNLGTVQADPGQIQQVVLNLVLNARDAMPDGGRLTLETANVVLDDAGVPGVQGGRPGLYALLAVSDTGIGIAPELQAMIFEPFFTTKEVGKGTGLGLSSVYGIVKQSGGNVVVSSEPGNGSVFKVYLPVVGMLSPAPAAVPEGARSGPAGGRETILLVEDEDSVRHFIRRTLEMQGYRLLEAKDGSEALGIGASHPGEIELLVTDVIMPRMGGRKLAEHFHARRPRTKVLFISGYTDDAIMHHGVLEADVEFLQKPFRPAQLAEKVRAILDGKPLSARAGGTLGNS